MRPRFPGSVSPGGVPITEDAAGCAWADGCEYPVRDGILDLLDLDVLEPELRRELETFETMPVKGLCYFRQEFLAEAARCIGARLGGGGGLSVVEIGGGEGYFARAFREQNPQGTAYVCDLSLAHLRLAPVELVRLRADARQPYLVPGSVDVAAFWVSLHHFPLEDLRAAIAQAARCLKPGGMILVFEPNAAFFPRHLLLATPLRRLVYYDDAEKPVSLSSIAPLFVEHGLALDCATSLNPPYNPEFLRRLRGGAAFYPAVQALYRLERALARPLESRLVPGRVASQRLLKIGLYLLAFFRSNPSQK